MKALSALLLFAALAFAGCVTKSKARAQAEAAFKAGENQALSRVKPLPPPPEQPVVTLVGQVRNPVVSWREGLTLAEAIDAAVYTGFTDPKLIRLVRGSEALDIKPDELLRGLVNPPLEAGDIIEIRR
jgi:hypothetical protein